MVILKPEIMIVSEKIIVNSKATETYVSVNFSYGDFIWKGYVPIEYRRTGVAIDYEDKDNLYSYLNNVYDSMDPNNYSKWKQEQDIFWKTEKPKADVTKSFFDVLADGEWKCGICEMPNNQNPQRRIQDLKDFGYTIATDLARYCPHCKKNTSQRILLRIPRCVDGGNGYEVWSPVLRKRIMDVLQNRDVYEDRYNKNCLPDHKFPEIRWDNKTKTENLDTMTDEEIRQKFQLLTNQRNQQKREVCRKCFQTGKRGYPFGIKYFYSGDENWNRDIPVSGRCAERGCVGCAWYDIDEWRRSINKKIKKNT